jgi:hypothetical protein
MRVSGSQWGVRRRPSRAILGWIVAVSLVAVACFGPPLTGQSMPALLQIRQNILTIDREFERWSIRTNASFNGSSAIVQDDLRRMRSKMSLDRRNPDERSF